jgi:hypothetical protein
VHGRRDHRHLPRRHFLALAGFAHVPCNPELIAILVAELMLLSFMLTGFGVMMAIKNLSGALTR